MGLDTVNNSFPSTPPRSLPLQPSSAPITPQRSRDRDECFTCRGLGHWAPDCPKKTPKRSPSSSPSSSTHGSDLPVVRCPCDRGVCRVITSNTVANPNRKFYSCPGDPLKGGKCKFFKWCDEFKGVPVCGCGVGTCSLNKMSTGPNKGKWYFACRIRKNHGACDFFQWVDSEVNSPQKVSQQPGYNSVNNFPGNEKVDSNNQIKVLQSEEDEVHNRHLIMQDVDSSNPTGNQLEVVAETGSHRVRDLRRNAGITIDEDVIYRILGLHIYGWLGRLAFPPSQGPKEPHVVPIFCCIFPSFDPVIEAEDEHISGVEGSSPTETTGKDVQVFRGFHPEPSRKKQDNDVQSKSIFKKLAQSLFEIFESMNPPNPDQMLKVSEGIFISMRALSIECGPFVEAVKDYIHNMSKLAAIEDSMHDGLSSDELISLCETEKARFNNISRNRSEALAAVNASEDLSQSLQAEISRMKGMLIQLEEQLLHCDAETSVYKARFDEACKDMSESEKSVEAVTFDLAEAIGLEREKELVSNAAKAAFEAAKVWLEE